MLEEKVKIKIIEAGDETIFAAENYQNSPRIMGAMCLVIVESGLLLEVRRDLSMHQ